VKAKQIQEQTKAYAKIMPIAGTVFVSSTALLSNGIQTLREKLVEVAESLSILSQEVPAYYIVRIKPCLPSPTSNIFDKSERKEQNRRSSS